MAQCPDPRGRWAMGNSSEQVRVDWGGWINGPCLPVTECRFCGTVIMLSADGLWHSREYADLGGWCPACPDDDRHQPC